MIILIHTSKTMREPVENTGSISKPELLSNTKILDNYLKTLSVKQLKTTMHISQKLADITHALIANWTDDQDQQNPTIDSFLGDIYSGLQVPTWTEDDRKYANKRLRILSGLYGILRPLDGIYPYRLEMGYRLPSKKLSNLYNFWGNSIAKTLPKDALIINLAAVEYSKAITNYIDEKRIITPRFLTVESETKEPTFVVVHAKIARGAFAWWLIKNKIDDINEFRHFQDLGYSYNQKLSTPNSPVFVCETFGGTGLSIRLKGRTSNQNKLSI
ncbi:MAG TPA: YaaA family protein [Candidatus Saccharimonadales bacterium]